MRSTLFHLPAELFNLPVFGVGLLLVAWVVFSVALLAWLVSRPGGKQEAGGYLFFLVIVGLVIAVFLPNMVERTPAGQPIGIPIRGFGVMLMLATISAVGLAAYRAWQVGIDPDAIYTLAFVMFIAGIVGARLFFIVQYWGEFRKLTPGGSLDLWATGKALFNVTQGGLVVYGSVLAGLPAGAWYCWRRGLPLLVVADIIAPSMVIGQALGRIGCFLNGCCYGGVCLTPALGLTFPAESPPYVQQLDSGWRSGVWVEEQDGRIVVAYVAPGSPAEGSKLQVGEELNAINGEEVADLESARKLLASSRGGTFAVRTSDDDVRWWHAPPLPARSVPVHATQLYAAIDAGLLAWVLWLAYPFRRRDGEIFALLVTIHPISRIVLEVIRSDEQGFLGSPLTISQWIGLGILTAACVLWWYVETNPKNRRTEEPIARGPAPA